MNPPPLDLHAHIDATIAPSELTALGAVVFAATRTLDEAAQALERDDITAVWGVGCHPAEARAHRSFDPGRFAELAAESSFASEIGLDGAAKVPIKTQRETFEAILVVLAKTPRITSIHSYRATAEVLECIEAHPIEGAILHWWLGDAEQTARAIELGCWFSINASSVRRGVLESIPLDRLLPETDHPFGDSSNGKSALPGNVASVERAISAHHNLDLTTVRNLMWSNLADLIGAARCASLLPRPIRLQLMASSRPTLS
jgi:TatD DNase family protein